MTRKSPPRNAGPADTPRAGQPRRSRGAPAIDDFHLWEHAARSVIPLARPAPRVAAVAPAQAPEPRAAVPPINGPASPGPGPGKPPAGRSAPAARTSPAVPPPPPPTLAPLDRRTTRRIAKGAAAIDARIDLHGCTQAVAERRLRSFLLSAQAAGSTMVLVITGKGGARDSGSDAIHRDRGSERGVLRRAVPLWLESPDLRAVVAACSPAHPRHGGEGALYVHLRKAGRRR